ncbi:glycosyltransferase [Vreelandella utahensis]|uniref:glycosyltransferase n=1 Tax=Vreelandella halophila TaxID=86177 RepID=UPI0015C3B6ED|nr:glycosyltransferase [Halomonas utahensis]
MHLIDSGGLYGAEKMLLSLATEQQALGLDVTILSAGEHGCGEKPIEAEAARLGLKIIAWRMKPGLNIKSMLKLVRWARAKQFELLHSHGYKFNILTAIMPRKFLCIPVVTTLHGFVRARRYTKMWFYELLDRFALKRLDAVCPVSESMRDEITPWVASHTIVQVVSNGLDLREIHRHADDSLAPTEIKEFIAHHSPVVVGVGRLSHEKGFDLLIGSFATVKEYWPKAGLIIVGEGPMRSELRKKADETGLSDSCLMPGYVANIPSILSAASVLVLSSRTEGLPITLLEAMAVGVPVVASDVGAIPSVLEEGELGRLTPAGDCNALANSITETLTDSASAHRKTEAARSHVEACYSARTMAQTYTDVYRSVLGRDGGHLRNGTSTEAVSNG